MHASSKVMVIAFLFLSGNVVTAQETYVLSPESKLTIEGTSTVHDWIVTANTMEGSVKMEGNAPSQVNFQVTVADIKSERGETMDNKMYEALKLTAHPKIRFSLHEIKSGTAFVGSLTIAGITKTVTIAGHLESLPKEVKIDGAYPMALEEFDIEPPTAMFGQVIVGESVTVKFNLTFERN